MGTKVSAPEWAGNIEHCLAQLKKWEEKDKEISSPAYRGYSEASYGVARKKYESERGLYQKLANEGYVIVDTIVNLPFNESAGLRLSKFFNGLKDGKILALRCPECRRVIFSPRAVCGFCRITLGEDAKEWLTLSDTGTVISIVLPTEREVDRATGCIVGEPNPCAFIRLDGGDEWTVVVHYLEMIDIEELKAGMRVRAVWRPKEERRGRMSDIAYFKIIDE